MMLYMPILSPPDGVAGWLSWPIGIMPSMQAMLKKFQLSPIELERFLQQRKHPAKDHPKVKLPRDFSLKAAVARMTEAVKYRLLQSDGLCPE